MVGAFKMRAQKYCCFAFSEIVIDWPPFRAGKGRIAIVTNVVRNAVDVDCAD